MTRRPVVVSWSGGKDSSLALAALRADPAYEIVGLLTSITQEYDRVSIHGVCRALVEAQASALGQPLNEVVLHPNSSNDAYEAAFLEAVEKLSAEHGKELCFAFGDLYLADVRAYRERLMDRAGHDAIFPLWRKDTTALAWQFIEDGFRATLVCIDTQQLPATFAGHDYNAHLLNALPTSADPCGENGEFHTFVWAGPIFETPIYVERGEIVLRDDRFAFCDLLLSP